MTLDKELEVLGFNPTWSIRFSLATVIPNHLGFVVSEPPGMCFQRCPSVSVWEAFLPHLRRGKGRVLHLGTSVAHNPQKGTATQPSGIEAM